MGGGAATHVPKRWLAGKFVFAPASMAALRTLKFKFSYWFASCALPSVSQVWASQMLLHRREKRMRKLVMKVITER